MRDPRPQARVKDSEAMRRFHMEMLGEPCEVCEERPGTRIHHRKYRSRGGDDTPENFCWVCVFCDSNHAALPQTSRYA